MKDAVLVFGGGSDHQTIHTLYAYGTKTGKNQQAKLANSTTYWILYWTEPLFCKNLKRKVAVKIVLPSSSTTLREIKPPKGDMEFWNALVRPPGSNWASLCCILPILPPVEQYVLINRFLYQIQPLITRKLFIFWIRSCNAPLLWGLAISLVCWGTTTGTCPETRWKTLGTSLVVGWAVSVGQLRWSGGTDTGFHSS